MRVVALTRYGELGASSRLRFYQYFEPLAALGVACEAHPLFDDSYLRRKYAGRRPSLVRLAAGAWARAADALRAREADVAWIEYELLPWCPPPVERWLASRLPPFVVEYDDAVFHRYDLHGSSLVRAAFRGKLASLMRHSRAVIAGNAYLRSYAERAGAPRVCEVPAAVDLRRFAAARTARPAGEVVVGWIGSPSTAPYLAQLVPLVPRLRERGVRLLVVGAGDAVPRGLDAERRAWSEDREAADLADMDIGVMPLDDGPWERGKCGHKLVQYMAAGLPVVASPVGATGAIVADGVTGLVATTPGEWAEAIERLAADAALRARMGVAGRARCEERFSVQAQAPVVARILREAAGAR